MISFSGHSRTIDYHVLLLILLTAMGFCQALILRILFLLVFTQLACYKYMLDL